MKVLAIGRAERYSPNSIDKDRAILLAVTERLLRRGNDVRVVGEDHLDGLTLSESPDLILTMGRRPETLAWLRTVGAEVVNSSEGIENCQRSRLQAIMERIGTPVPPVEGSDGYWLKRGDAAARRAVTWYTLLTRKGWLWLSKRCSDEASQIMWSAPMWWVTS